MESFLIGSSSVTFGGNLWRSKHGANKNIYYASSYLPKALEHKIKIQDKYDMLKQPSGCSHYKYIRGGSPNQEYCSNKYTVKASLESNFESRSTARDLKTISHSIKNFLVSLYNFTRPNVAVGIALSAISTSLLAVENLSHISPLFFTSVFKAIVPYIFMAIYVGGLNQLFDLEIDKINKPYLPLASGKLSFTTGVIIVSLCLIMSFWLAWNISSLPLMWGILSYFLLGTAYSVNVPLLRWKGHPVLAAICIVATWAFIYPISFFLHMQTFVFKKMTIFLRPLILVTVFMSIYHVGMALCKDIADIEGDKAFGIDSFSAHFGPKQVFWICVSLFEMAFGFALLMGVTSSSLWSKVITGVGHAVLASILWYNAKSVDLGNKASVLSFYEKITWKLLFAEYFLIPLVR